MEKLADISAFESLCGGSSAVFNGSWNYHPVTVADVQKRCRKIQHLSSLLSSLLTADDSESRNSDIYLHQLDPAKVLMVEETARDLSWFADMMHKDAVGASDAAERKHYRNKIAEKYPDVDLNHISSEFKDALDARHNLREYHDVPDPDNPSEIAWDDFYRRLHGPDWVMRYGDDD